MKQAYHLNDEQLDFIQNGQLEREIKKLQVSISFDKDFKSRMNSKVKEVSQDFENGLKLTIRNTEVINNSNRSNNVFTLTEEYELSNFFGLIVNATLKAHFSFDFTDAAFVGAWGTFSSPRYEISTASNYSKNQANVIFYCSYTIGGLLVWNGTRTCQSTWYKTGTTFTHRFDWSAG